MLVAFLARTILSAAMRIVYPFLPAIARGLGILLATASALVTLRLVAGIAAPFLGPVSDRFGRRRSMVGALLVFVVASILLAGIGTLPAAAVAEERKIEDARPVEALANDGESLRDDAAGRR